MRATTMQFSYFNYNVKAVVAILGMCGGVCMCVCVCVFVCVCGLG